jgi:hypothetical protein
MQAVFYVSTANASLAVILFQIIFFPGILLHEFSHFAFARVLGVKTGRFSLVPQQQGGGRLRMGYVEIYRSDVAREALIGAAPLISGMVFLAVVARWALPLTALWDILGYGRFDLFLQGFPQLFSYPLFWLWFYLIFVISSTMTPSPSDRHAWLPVGLILGGLLALAVLAGAGDWMLANLAPPLNEFLRACALLLGLSVIVHALLIIPFWMLHRLAARAFQRDIRI